MIRRKRLLTAVLVFSLVTSISAWGQSKPILTVYTYNSFTSEWGPGPTLAKDFEAQCGCDLNWVSLEDGAALLARLKLEGKSTKADVVLGLDTNLTAAFLFARAAEKPLRASRGAIVTIASTRALMSEPNTESYAASKGGLVALTHALAISLAPEVRVNCISPGWIVVRREQEEKLRRKDHLQHPAGRVGRPEDIAEMAAFLLDRDRAGFVTGANFVVDGGMTRKMIYEE